MSIDLGSAVLQMRDGLLILLERNKKKRNPFKKVAPALPTAVSPKSDTLLSINREKMVQRFQMPVRWFELEADCRNGALWDDEKCQKTFSSCSSA